jgi:glutamate synthase domain-containing protein 3
MSGGELYVHDADTSFPARVNTAMVRVARPTPAEQAALKALVEEHVAATGSPRGAALLAYWPTEAARFWRVAAAPPVVELDVEGEEEKAEAAAR